MIAPSHVSAALAGLGTTVLLSGRPWFGVIPLGARVAPYCSTDRRPSPTKSNLTGQPLLAVVLPLIVATTARIAQLLGQTDPVEMRLSRVGTGVDAAAFRLRQGTSAIMVSLGVAATSTLMDVPTGARAAIVALAPIVTVLSIEQALTRQSVAWQRQILTELPTVAERLGMLLGAGFSLTAAMSRLSERGHGHCAGEFRRIQHRVGHGLAERDALAESAGRVGIEPYRRLVSVLMLNREASDLGTLITHEARQIRQIVHRTQMAELERRGQQVWIPVTVATLLPGITFLAIPFIDAMSQLTN